MTCNKLKHMEKPWNVTHIKMKLRIIRTCIFPTATYGCETGTMNKNITKHIRAFENNCYRKVLGGCPFNGPLSGMKYPSCESPRRDAASSIKYNGTL